MSHKIIDIFVKHGQHLFHIYMFNIENGSSSDHDLSACLSDFSLVAKLGLADEAN